MKKTFGGFSRKQQQVVSLFCLLYGLWLAGNGYFETHGNTLPAIPLLAPTPSGMLVYIDPPIDINTAHYEELQLLPSIGPVLAERILLYREQYGTFRSVDALQKIHGIGPKTVQKLQYYLEIKD